MWGILWTREDGPVKERRDGGASCLAAPGYRCDCAAVRFYVLPSSRSVKLFGSSDVFIGGRPRKQGPSGPLRAGNTEYSCDEGGATLCLTRCFPATCDRRWTTSVVPWTSSLITSTAPALASRRAATGRVAASTLLRR